jgi:hypothetical protein
MVFKCCRMDYTCAAGRKGSWCGRLLQHEQRDTAAAPPPLLRPHLKRAQAEEAVKLTMQTFYMASSCEGLMQVPKVRAAGLTSMLMRGMSAGMMGAG